MRHGSIVRHRAGFAPAPQQQGLARVLGLLCPPSTSPLPASTSLLFVVYRKSLKAEAL
jgi:hypothetical protein